MTERLYFENSYLSEWSARIVERTVLDGRVTVILDRSAFYPTGGGQPHDCGEISGFPVIDVRNRHDGAVLHILDGEAPGTDEVVCVLNWQRRLELMRHHSAQHILTRASEWLFGAETIGFHLTVDNATIDLNRKLDNDQIEEIVVLANHIVIENRDVECAWHSESELAGVRMRGVAPRKRVRVVRIVDFDVTACGGTHVRTTGELGLIQVTRKQQRGASTRLTYVCGERAIHDYNVKNAILRELSGVATRPINELPSAFQHQKSEIKRLKRHVKRLHSLLIESEVRELRNTSQKLGAVHLIRKVYPDNEEIDFQMLANQVQSQNNCIALLARSGQAAQLLFVCGEGHDELLQTAMAAAVEQISCAEIAFSGRQRVQSKPFAASAKILEGALNAARQQILTHLDY